MKNITLRIKLTLSFVAVLILTGTTAVIMLGQLNTVTQIAQESYTHGITGTKLIGDAISEAQYVRERLLLLHSAVDTLEQERQRTKMDNHNAQTLALIETYKPLIKTEGSQAAIADFEAAWIDYEIASDEVVQLSLSGEKDAAYLVLKGDAEHQLTYAINLLLLAQDIEDNLSRGSFLESQAVFQRARNMAFGTTGLAIALGLGLAFWLARTIAEPMAEMAEAAQEAASGNFSRAISVEATGDDEIGVLARAFNNMTTELQETLAGLEKQVADRTRALETSTEVSRRISTILDRDQLAKEVVEQLVTAFDYYYAHIYLYGEDKNTLVMMGGTGEAGQVLLSRGHTIEKGRGLVGRAAETNSVVLVADTLNEEGWLPNELLPETRSEIAVPISIGDEVLGVFDVQHNVVGAITEDDASLLQSIANQVAVAVQNAEIYVVAQKRAAHETLVGDIGQKIQNTTTVEDALQVAVRELGRVLNAERSNVQLNLEAKKNERSEV